MNFSTVPPSASIADRIASKYMRMTARIRSGSRRSARPVDPATSANRTVTTLRSPSLTDAFGWGGAGEAATAVVGVPQAEQNAEWGTRSAPQFSQARTVAAPHHGQKRAAASRSAPHDPQVAITRV